MTLFHIRLNHALWPFGNQMKIYIYIYQVLFPVTFLGVLNDPFRGVK